MTLEDVLITFGRRDVLPIVGLGLLSVILWSVPIVKLLFVPFRVLNTIIHELGHVIAARVTGGKFRRFIINPGGGGSTPVDGGDVFVIGSAGYTTAALFGGVLILLTTSSIPSRAVLMGLGILLALICIMFVGNLFGIVMGLATAFVLYYGGWQLDDKGAATILLFLAVQMILASFRSLFIQLDVSRHGPGTSDAERLEHITAIPAILWALLWCLIAVVALVWSITTAYRDLPLY